MEFVVLLTLIYLMTITKYPNVDVLVAMFGGQKNLIKA
jgi:hypothetical protein